MHLVTRQALFDELEKISNAERQEPTRGARAKNWLKRTAVITAGFGTGYLAGMLADRAAEAIGGPGWWTRASPTVRHRVLPLVSGIAGMGSMAAYHLMRNEAERKKQQQEGA